MSYKENINRNRERTAQERVAVNLHERLEKLLLTGRENTERRWIWELLQNSSDMAGADGVKIKLNLDGNYLLYSHNGKVFNSSELSRLTEQDSSKRDEEGDERSIGRFGTGFLTTHLLSRRVHVEGVIHDEGEPPKRVDLILDRSGETPQELKKGVENAFKALDNLDKAQDVSYRDGEFNTTFRYDLSNGGQDVLERGLEDLERCLPLTLVFNNRIKSVQLEHQNILFQVSKSVNMADDIKLIQVERKSLDSNTSSFYEYVTINGEDNVLIALPKLPDEKSIKLSQIPSNLPRLFCAFPLIGSEGFPLPFIINSEEFHPTERRDGILLTDANHIKPNENKEKISRTVKLYWRLVEFAVDNNWQNLFVFADIKSIPKFDWISSSWIYSNILKPIKEQLIFESIVETESGEIKPFQTSKSRITRIPVGKDETTRKKLWKFFKDINPQRIPKEDLIEEWYPQIWDDVQRLYPEDLIRLISSTTNLEGLSKYFDGDINNTLAWLLDVIHYLIDTDNEKMLNRFKGRAWYYEKGSEGKIIAKLEFIEHPILPNQFGKFNLLKDLKVDKTEDETLKDILELLGCNIRVSLLHKNLSNQPIFNENESLQFLSSKTIAKEIEERVRQRISSGDRHEEAFINLLYWFDRNEEKAKTLFPVLFKEQHLLQSAEEAKEIRKKAAEAENLASEVNRLKAEIEILRERIDDEKSSKKNTQDENQELFRAQQLIEVWSAIKKALNELGDAEHQMALKDLENWFKEKPGLFEHISISAKSAYLKWINKVQRAKRAVRSTLENNSNYDCSEWLDDNRFPTIVQGVLYRSTNITLVIRPADEDYIVLYDEIEKDVLSLPNTELWIEGGNHSAQRFTIGKFASWLGVNRLPLKVPEGRPVKIHLS